MRLAGDVLLLLEESEVIAVDGLGDEDREEEREGRWVPDPRLLFGDTRCNVGDDVHTLPSGDARRALGERVGDVEGCQEF